MKILPVRFNVDLAALTNDVEGSDNEEQDAASGVALDVRNGAESDALIDARTSRKHYISYFP